MSSLSRELSALQPLMQILESTVDGGQGATVQLVQPNPYRWGLRICPPFSLGTAWVVSTLGNEFGNAGGDLLSYWNTTSNSGFSHALDINVRNHGILPCQAWFGGKVTAAAASTPVTWMVQEILLLPVD